MDLTSKDLTDEAIAERFAEPEVAAMVMAYRDAARLEIVELAKANKHLPWVRVDGELRSYMVDDIVEVGRVVPMAGGKVYAETDLPAPVMFDTEAQAIAWADEELELDVEPIERDEFRSCEL